MKSKMAKATSWMMTVALVGVLLVTAVMAQRGPGRPSPQGMQGNQGRPGGPGGPPPPQMKAGNEGVFVLQGGTLLKYDAALSEQGTLRLIEPPAQSSGSDNGAQKPQMPPMGGVLLIAPAAGGATEKVVTLIGDNFFAVDAASLQITAKTHLPQLDAPDNAPQMGQMPLGPPPSPALELRGRVLYVLRANQITSINIDNGSLTGKATLPKPPAPPAEN